MQVWKCVFHPIWRLAQFLSLHLLYPRHAVMRKEPPCLWMKQVKRFITSHGALIKACGRVEDSFPDWSFSVCEMYKSLFAHCLTWLLNRISGLKSKGIRNKALIINSPDSTKANVYVASWKTVTLHSHSLGIHYCNSLTHSISLSLSLSLALIYLHYNICKAELTSFILPIK